MYTHWKGKYLLSKIDENINNQKYNRCLQINTIKQIYKYVKKQFLEEAL